MTLVLTSAGLQLQTVTTGTAGAGNTATFPLNGAPSVTMAIGGTMTSMTLTFEATVDGQTWFAIGARKLADDTIVATTTATGLFAFTNTGLQAVRVRCTTYSSGAAECLAGIGTW